MRIDRRLNLVIPVYHDDDKIYYVHSTPISREIFEQNYRVLGYAFNGIYARGLGIAGPRMAALELKKAGKDMTPEGERDAAADLLSEIRRLTVVLAPKDGGGWDQFLWGESVTKELFTDDDTAEVENAIAFFTVASWVHKKREMPGVHDVLLGNWSALTSSLAPMEYANSLRTSTAPATTPLSGLTPAKPSSIPS